MQVTNTFIFREYRESTMNKHFQSGKNLSMKGLVSRDEYLFFQGLQYSIGTFCTVCYDCFYNFLFRCQGIKK